MAVIAQASTYKQRTNTILILACVAFGAWFFYDGWFNAEFQEANTRSDGTANVTLQLNRIWIPLGCVVAAAYFGLSSLRCRSKQVVADAQGLLLANGARIAYEDILKIDKREFQQKGRFAVTHEGERGSEQVLTLSDRDYDGLGLLLDELVKQTGAAPQSEAGGQGA